MPPLALATGISIGGTPELDPEVIAKAAGTRASVGSGGAVRIGWARDDVPVDVDGRRLPPSAGLGSWAAFQPLEEGVLVMGDTVVFQDEVDAAMDAVFAGGLEVTALHNHFFYEDPPVYFMHIRGSGEPKALASAVKAVWDAIKAVRKSRPKPADGFGGPRAKDGALDAAVIGEIIGLTPAETGGGVLKVSTAREGRTGETTIGGSMGLTTWAAFSGSDEAASIDGDFIMTAEEVTPVLKALRKAGIHVVALHNHMLREKPSFYFAHYWATGPARDLARGFRAALDAQRTVQGGP